MRISFDSNANTQLVTEMFNKLANDDQFRQEFASNPQATLQQYGVVLETGVSVTVPPKDKINDFLNSLQTSPLSTTPDGMVKLNTTLKDNLIFFG